MQASLGGFSLTEIAPIVAGKCCGAFKGGSGLDVPAKVVLSHDCPVAPFGHMAIRHLFYLLQVHLIDMYVVARQDHGKHPILEPYESEVPKDVVQLHPGARVSIIARWGPHRGVVSCWIGLTCGLTVTSPAVRIGLLFCKATSSGAKRYTYLRRGVEWCASLRMPRRPPLHRLNTILPPPSLASCAQYMFHCHNLRHEDRQVLFEDQILILMC
jgi:hypothetical protein